MRANLAVVDDPVGASRQAFTTSLERVKEARRLDELKAKSAPQSDRIILRDEAGQCWAITVSTKGVLTVAAVIKEPSDAETAGK